MPDALVQLPALLQEQPVVGDLLREALAETVLVVREQILAVEDAAAFELGELRGHVDPLAVQQRSSWSRRNCRPRTAADLHHALRLGAEPVETCRDHLPHGAGNAESPRRGRVSEAGRPSSRHVALLEQGARDLLGEERAALRLAEDPLLELAGSGPPATARTIARVSASESGRSDELRERRAACATPRGSPVDG